MSGIWIQTPSPFLVQTQIGGATVGIRWYGLAYVLGFILAWLYFRKAMRDGTVKGLTPEALEQLTYALIGGVVIGGRLGFVLQHPRTLLVDPLFAIRVWEGGMAFFGGLLGVVLAVWWVARRNGLSIPEMLDIVPLPAALGLAVGRIANFVNGELVGMPTDGTWGVVFTNVDRVPRHPSQLYESASHFVLFLIILAVWKWAPRWWQARRGRLFDLFICGYGFLRLITDFWRSDETYLGPLSTGQWASLILGLIGLAMMLRPAPKKT